MFPLHSEMPYIKEDGKRSTLGDMLDQESTDISDLKTRMTAAEGDIDDLETFQTTATGKLSTLETFKTTAEGQISDLNDAISDAYNAETTYAVGDYFIYEDKIYEVITACTGITPPNAEYYTSHNVTDLISTLNSNLNRVELLGSTQSTSNVLVSDISGYRLLVLVLYAGTDVVVTTSVFPPSLLQTLTASQARTIVNGTEVYGLAQYSSGNTYIRTSNTSNLVALYGIG